LNNYNYMLHVTATDLERRSIHNPQIETELWNPTLILHFAAALPIADSVMRVQLSLAAFTENAAALIAMADATNKCDPEWRQWNMTPNEIGPILHRVTLNHITLVAADKNLIGCNSVALIPRSTMQSRTKGRMQRRRPRNTIQNSSYVAFLHSSAAIWLQRHRDEDYFWFGYWTHEIRSVWWCQQPRNVAISFFRWVSVVTPRSLCHRPRRTG
jgi:hypothetical protein